MDAPVFLVSLRASSAPRISEPKHEQTIIQRLFSNLLTYTHHSQLLWVRWTPHDSGASHERRRGIFLGCARDLLPNGLPIQQAHIGCWSGCGLRDYRFLGARFHQPLPVRCSMQKYCSDKDINKVIRTLLKTGWTFKRGRVHGRVYPPFGKGFIVIPSTPSDRRWRLHIRSYVRKFQKRDDSVT
ncbi:hypothetical protein RUE5091_03732 [Ruegeria denitrificans]|uniref:Uncharacterized protein n=1 Tax=Ruegeria denitrificans TaxID=1715692 RepID=A0A0P1IY99_9RHOB|nr:hypothetical protein RUE5091_03732 [Ruegeria denitrificans]